MSDIDEDEINVDETNNWNGSAANEGDGDYEYDLYNLASFNYQPIEVDDSNPEEFEEILYQLSCKAAQDLVNKLFQCPIQKADVGPVAQLPSEKTRLPREKVIPEPKQLTKWEKFAKTKGIQKTKKERMVYDDTSSEYKPRYGYKGINSGLDEIPVVEVKPGQDPYADPWAEDKKQRKGKVTKNLTNKLKNDLRRSGKGSGSSLSASPISVGGKKNKRNSMDANNLLSSTKNIPVDLGDNKKKRGKEGLRNALEISQISTASMGRYDEMRKNEPEKKLKGKKRSYRDNFMNDKDEKQIMKSQLRIIDDKLDKKKRGVTNSLKAYEGIIPDAPSDQFKSKKGKSSTASATSAGSSGSKSKSPKKSTKATPAAKKRKM